MTEKEINEKEINEKLIIVLEEKIQLLEEQKVTSQKIIDIQNEQLTLTDYWKLHVKRLLQLVDSGAVDGNRLHDLKLTDTYNTLLKMTKQ